MNDNSKSQLEELKRKVDQMADILASAKRVLARFEVESTKPDYSQIDGLVGKFDGYHMITDKGEKYEVPSNYAAKSKIVYGDVLKMIEDGGKQIFKQIEKVDRTKVDGILTKKEGEWYILTDRGSYRVSEAAAEFQKAQLNSQCVALLPTAHLDAPFATIDSVEGFDQTAKAPEPKTVVKTEKLVEKKPQPRVDKAPKEIDLKPGNKTVPLPRSDKEAPRRPVDRPVRRESRPMETSKPRPPRTDRPRRSDVDKEEPEVIPNEEQTKKSAATIQDDDLL